MKNLRYAFTGRAARQAHSLASRTAFQPLAALALLCIGGFGLAAPASANERHFGYAYETATLPVGAKEFELWNTVRFGRDQYYSRLDHRAEFEFGIARYVMGAFYLNWSKTTQYADGDLQSALDWQGISTEVKVQLTDPSANAVGSALYLEAGYNTDALELEGKALFDKHYGQWIFASNLVAEIEWERDVDIVSGTGRETELEMEEAEAAVHLAAAYEVGHGFTAGLEGMVQGEYKHLGEEWELETVTFHVGPSLSYASKAWWINLSLLPQLPAAKSEGESMLDLQDHERMQIRLLLAFHL